MNKEHIIDSIGRIDDDMIEAVDKLRQSRRSAKPLWQRLGAIAAAACLLAVLALPIIHAIADKENVSDWFDHYDQLHTIAILEYDGCYYEAVNDPDVLERYGLPKKITTEMAGEHIAYLQSDGGSGYLQSVSPTDIALYAYAPRPCQGVYMLKDGSTWYAALFCNFILSDTDAHCAFSELYSVYGIESADDIAAVTEVDWNNDRAVGQEVTNSEEISRFYDISLRLVPYGNDSFQRLMFGTATEEEQADRHTQFADDHRGLRIETADGLRFYIVVYPAFGWIYGSGTMTYYQMDDAMSQWFERNIG